MNFDFSEICKNPMAPFEHSVDSKKKKNKQKKTPQLVLSIYISLCFFCFQGMIQRTSF